MISLTTYLFKKAVENPEINDDLVLIIGEIASATKTISGKVRKASILDILGSAKKTNVQGEEVQKLDELANEIIIETLKCTGKICMIASEEVEDCLVLEGGDYSVAFDPLDGSSNIDVNISIGTIFSIHKNDVKKRGREQIAAGYVIYGSSTMMVLAFKGFVSMFCLDPESGNYLLVKENLKMPEKGKIYSINEANYNKWVPESLKDFINSLKNQKYTLRYVGSMVADVHRTLIKGGIFIYPADRKNKNGKLRLLYEASPMAFIIENAGGLATTGEKPILDVEPQELHQRVPVILGSRYEVEECLKFINNG